MAKRPFEDGRRWRHFLILLSLSCACLAAYLSLSPLLHNSLSSSAQAFRAYIAAQGSLDGEEAGCCRGLERTEYWDDAVNVGSDLLLNTSQECCTACKSNSNCNSWVYCNDGEKCGQAYRQCWLKRQKDPLNPEVHDVGPSTPWTSGLVFREEVGIVELVIDSGTIRIELLPDCAPKSVEYILELVKLTHCSGCRVYRAEGRGNIWNSDGLRMSKMSTGPPYAVIQGTLEAQHFSFKGMPSEYRPGIRRGMVGWVGNGPDFFISLADHNEWPRKHTVFATVVEGDVRIVEELTKLPSTTTRWEGVSVAVLDNPVNLKLRRATKL